MGLMGVGGPSLLDLLAHASQAQAPSRPAGSSASSGATGGMANSHSLADDLGGHAASLYAPVQLNIARLPAPAAAAGTPRLRASTVAGRASSALSLELLS